MKPLQIIAYDVGTTGIKTCLFEIGTAIRLIGSETASYPLYILENGGAEQDPLDWWAAMCATTRRLIAKTKTDPGGISGISFCSQMQALVLVDSEGNPLRRAMTYMDQRAGQEMKEIMGRGLKLSGMNIFILLSSIRETGAVNASVKDPVWKYKWVQKNEPRVFSSLYKWLDVKEFLICRATGSFIMTEDSAFAALLYDPKPATKNWSKKICRLLGVNMEHLAGVISPTDLAGKLSAAAAAECGLAEGTPVFGGGGDASLIGIGAGLAFPGETHIYTGTSGWVSTVVEKQLIDPFCMIASIVGAQQGRFNYFAEMETAGKCLEWTANLLAPDQVDSSEEAGDHRGRSESTRISIYETLTRHAGSAAAGSGGLLFAPWLHGNRCPFEDSKARGIFFNFGLETGRNEIIRAVLEGVCFHLRWMLEAQDRKVKTSDPIRLVGGGALSQTTCQILADITGKKVETVADPQNVGAVGAALVAAVGLGLVHSFEAAGSMITVSKTFSPDPGNRAVYEHSYKIFKKLYPANRKLFHALN